MGITHVVRGNEYLSSAPKYNKIYEAFVEATKECCAESENYAHVWDSMMKYRETMNDWREAQVDWDFGINFDESSFK